MNDSVRVLLLTAAACALTACSVTADVHGIVGNEDNPFTGKATGYMDQTGTISLNNGQGVECVGSFAYTGAATGLGQLTCNDGQRADIQFNAITAVSGYGYGVSNRGQPIRFTYGLSPQEGRRYLQAPPVTTASTAAPTAPTPPRPAQKSVRGSGSGFVVSRDGHILTNHHVVDGCGSVRAALTGKPADVVSVISTDQANDLALLKVNSRMPSVAAFRSDRSVRQGDSIVAYGFPLAGALSSAGNITTGSVSALAGLKDDARFLQISAPVQPGNSGGPLLDMSGNLVGVVTGKLNAIKVAGVTGDIPQNVNFALKASVAQAFLEASGINVLTSPSGRTLTNADIGDKARAVTTLVECLN